MLWIFDLVDDGRGKVFHRYEAFPAGISYQLICAGAEIAGAVGFDARQAAAERRAGPEPLLRRDRQNG